MPMPPPRTIDPSLRQFMRLVDFIGCPTTHCASLLAKNTSTSGCKQLLAVHVPCAVMKAVCTSQRRPGCEEQRAYPAMCLRRHAGMASGVVTATCQGLVWCSCCGTRADLVLCARYRADDAFA